MAIVFDHAPAENQGFAEMSFGCTTRLVKDVQKFL
jgi:hypothetical protein